MGGGQMYVYNKAQYLKANNYKVYIFSVFSGDIIIKGLEEYKDDIISELGHPIFFFSLSQQNKIINLIVNKIAVHPDDVIIIESNSINNALWGEKISELINCKHFIYLLSENNLIYMDRLYPFMKFKYNRREMAGITQKTIKWLFSKYCKIDTSKSYVLPASCINVVEDFDHELINNIPQKNYTIGMIGRLEKLYFLPILDDILVFCNNHPDKSFNIIIIGDTQDEILMNKIKTKFTKINNVNLLITGYLYPIPLQLLDLCDVFISSSGSARLTNEYGFITISIDGNDYKPIGILGYTTNNVLFRDDEPIVEVNDLLENILIFEKYPKRFAKIYDTSFIDRYNKEHMDFIADSDQSKEYFNIDTIQPNLLYNCRKAIYIVKRLVRFTVGNSTYVKFSKIKKYIINKVF